MNSLAGEIVSFIEKDELSLVSISTTLGEFSVLMLGFSQSLNAQKGSKVQLLFNENELILAKIGAQLGIDNAFKSKISSIEKGEIFWQVFLEDSNLSAMLSAKIAQTLNLEPNNEVLCFVRASNIIIKVL